MKRTTLLAATALIALASTAVIATAHDRDGNRGDRGMRGAPMQMMFQKFDLNGDGSITEAEIAEAKAAMFAQADANGDGQLSAEEMAAAAEAMQAERRAARMAERIADQIERNDANGDGMLSLEEVSAMGDEKRMERMFDMLDADNDGTVTQAELEEMQGHRHGKGRWFRHGMGRN